MSKSENKPSVPSPGPGEIACHKVDKLHERCGGIMQPVQSAKDGPTIWKCNKDSSHQLVDSKDFAEHKSS